jgi:hypothetical protein
MIKRAKVQMPDGTIKIAIIEVPDQTTPMEAAVGSIKSLFQPSNPADAVMGYSPLPTQSKANTGLAAADALTFGGASKALRAISPTLPEPNEQERVMGETAGVLLPGEAVASVAGKVAGTAKNVGRVLTKETPYIEEITKLIRKPFTEAGEKLGKSIDEIDMATQGQRKLSLTDTTLKIMEEAETNPAIKTAINRSPTLRRVMENPGLSDNITARMSQDIINELKGTASMQNKLSGATKAMPVDHDVMDIIGQIRKEQLQAFPELKEAFKDYGKVATNYWRVKNLSKVDKAKGFMRGETGQSLGNAPVGDAVNKLSPEAYRMAKDYNIAKSIPKAVGYATGGAAVAEIIRRMFSK